MKPSEVIELDFASFSAIQNLKTVNKLTADDKNSLLNRDNLMQAIPILLSQKQQKFSPFLSAHLQSTLNFELFQKNR